MAKFRIPVVGANLPPPIRCIDIDPTVGERIGVTCKKRRKNHKGDLMRVTMIPSLMTRWLALGAALALACNDSISEQPTPGVPPVAAENEVLPTAILVELPSGIEVSVNGRARGVTPLAAIEVEPGTYSVTLVAGCKTVHVPLDVRAHETKKIDVTSVAELGLVPLEIVAKDKAGEALEHTVALDDEVLGGGKGTSTTMVPPCKTRLKVASEGLGGFIEDIDFGEEERVRREVVLLPGPDMVRLHGGPFTPGTVPGRRSSMCDRKPYYEVEVQSFDIDRTEVTVEQWLACRKAGGCPSTFTNWSVTENPTGAQYLKCNVEVLSIATEPPVRPGREKLPMNCVAHWEAEDYCRWVGKRLPTDVEWEYAGRSGRSDFRFSWGSDYSACKFVPSHEDAACMFGEQELTPPCSYPNTNTLQGVCDMMGNVLEMVTYDRFPGRQETHEEPFEPQWINPEHRQYEMGSGPGSIQECTTTIDGLWGRWDQHPHGGFRCARDIEPSISQK